MTYIEHAAAFLIQSICDIFLLLLLLRFFFQYLRIDYYNPFSQFIIKVTNPIIVPLRRVIPGYWGLDFATLAVIFVVSYLKLLLVSVLSFHAYPGLIKLLSASVGDVLGLTLNLFFYAILFHIIISWVGPYIQTPLRTILHQLSEPLLRLARKWIPPLAGFDVSPILVLMILQLLNILIVGPLRGHF